MSLTRKSSSQRSSISKVKSSSSTNKPNAITSSVVQLQEEIVETDDGGDLDEALSLTEVLPNEFQVVPEYKEVLQEAQTYYTREEPISTTFPNIDEMYLTAVKSVETSCTLDRVIPMFRKLHYVLADARTENESLREKLAQREDDMQNLADKLRRDPRVAKVILLADRWRQEKNNAEAMNTDYRVERDEMALNVKDTEAQLHHCKEGQKRMAESIEQAKELESRVEKMEEAALKRESIITELKEHIEKLNLQAELDVAENERQRGILQAKLAAAPDRNAKQLDMLTRQVALLVHNKAERKAELEELQHRTKTLTQKLEKCRREMGVLKKSLKASVEHIRDMTCAVRRANAANNSLQQKNDHAAQTIALLRSEMSALRGDTENLNSKVEELNSTVSKLESINKSKDDQIFKLQDDMCRTKKALQEAKRENHCHEAAEAKLKQQLERDTHQIRFIDQKLTAKQAKLRDAENKINQKEEGLKVAGMNVATMARNLNYTMEELKKARRDVKKYDNRVHAMTSLVTYLDDVVQDHQRTIRLKDGKNDSLIVQITHLERLLEECRDNKIKLRQLNLLATTENENQKEMHNVLTNMLSFTECQLSKSVRNVTQRDNNLIILKREQAQRFRELMNAYRDMTDQKMKINEQITLLESQKKQIQVLARIIRKAEEDDRAKDLQIGTLRQDRDILGATVIQRNNEILLLSRKMEIYNDVLKRGFHDYNERGKDLVILKNEIQRLRKRVKALSTTDVLNDTLKGEVVHTTRLLVQAQDRLQVAETFPTTRPHHYTYMMNAEPSEYEKVLKIQKLQRLLLKKTTHIAEKESKIMAQEQALLQLKMLLAKRPIVNCGHRLQSFKATVREKNKGLKALLGEINIVKSDLEIRKENEQKLSEQLKEAKEEIAMYKRKLIHSHPSPVIRPNPDSVGPRTAGGGFVFRGKPGTISTVMTATITKQLTTTTSITKK